MLRSKLQEASPTMCSSLAQVGGSKYVFVLLLSLLLEEYCVLKFRFFTRNIRFKVLETKKVVFKLGLYVFL